MTEHLWTAMINPLAHFGCYQLEVLEVLACRGVKHNVNHMQSVFWTVQVVLCTQALFVQ